LTNNDFNDKQNCNSSYIITTNSINNNLYTNDNNISKILNSCDCKSENKNETNVIDIDSYFEPQEKLLKQKTPKKYNYNKVVPLSISPIKINNYSSILKSKKIYEECNVNCLNLIKQNNELINKKEIKNRKNRNNDKVNKRRKFNNNINYKIERNKAGDNYLNNLINSNNVVKTSTKQKKSKDDCETLIEGYFPNEYMQYSKKLPRKESINQIDFNLQFFNHNKAIHDNKTNIKCTKGPSFSTQKIINKNNIKSSYHLIQKGEGRISKNNYINSFLLNNNKNDNKIKCDEQLKYIIEDIRNNYNNSNRQKEKVNCIINSSKIQDNIEKVNNNLINNNFENEAIKEGKCNSLKLLLILYI